MKFMNMLSISQNSQVQLLCVHGAWECVGGRMSACACVCVSVCVCVCVTCVCWRATAAAAGAVRLLSIRVNYSQHVRPEHSEQASPAASSEPCVAAVSGLDNTVNQSRPHQSVFMKTWLTSSVSGGPTVTLSCDFPLSVWDHCWQTSDSSNDMTYSWSIESRMDSYGLKRRRSITSM